MSATTMARAEDRVVRRHATPEPIPFGRILRVELAKMFDTRSGFWLMMSIALAAVVATGAVIAFAPNDELTYETFATAIGAPIAIILPMVAVLAVTSEWSQRSGLTTFTLVPHRSRVIAAKLVLAVAIGVASMALAFVIGAAGNLLGTAIAGVDTTWGVSFTDYLQIILANVLGMLVGFMLAVLIRSSAGAIVAYFVYALLLPTVSSALTSTQHWYEDHSPWFDFNYAQSALFNGHMTTEQWSQLGVSGLVWLVIPLAIGLRIVLRTEVK
jgi:ABC-type transport system involved in multi-copper enzyme maturation permease subunit